MSSYALEVITPNGPGAQSEKADRLSFALESLAMIHGGKLVEPPGAPAEPSHHRQLVSIHNCESTLEKEVEWLRREFPETRFTLRQLTNLEPRQGLQTEHPSADRRP